MEMRTWIWQKPFLPPVLLALKLHFVLFISAKLKSDFWHFLVYVVLTTVSISLTLAVVYGIPLEISDAVPISAPSAPYFLFFFFKNKRQPQSPTRTVTGKFENVTQMPPYYQAQESGCKRNKPNPSFNLGNFKTVSFYLDLKYDLDYLGMGNNKVFLSSLREGDALLSFQFSWGQFLIQVGSLSLAHETFNATIILKRIRKILAIEWEKRIFLPLILFLLFFYRFLLLVVMQLCLHTEPNWDKWIVLLWWRRLSSSHFFLPLIPPFASV